MFLLSRTDLSTSFYRVDLPPPMCGMLPREYRGSRAHEFTTCYNVYHNAEKAYHEILTSS